MSDQSFPLHHESAGLAHAPVEQVFAFLDDPKALAAHMGESSMMMLPDDAARHFNTTQLTDRLQR